MSWGSWGKMKAICVSKAAGSTGEYRGFQEWGNSHLLFDFDSSSPTVFLLSNFFMQVETWVSTHSAELHVSLLASFWFTFDSTSLDWPFFLLYLNFWSWILLEQGRFSLSVCKIQLCTGVQLDFAGTIIIELITAINNLICIPIAHPLRYHCNLQGCYYLFSICLSA